MHGMPNNSFINDMLVQSCVLSVHNGHDNRNSSHLPHRFINDWVDLPRTNKSDELQQSLQSKKTDDLEISPICFENSVIATGHFRNMTSFYGNLFHRANSFSVTATLGLKPYSDPIQAIPYWSSVLDVRTGACFVSKQVEQPFWSVDLKMPTPIGSVILQGSVPACIDTADGLICLPISQYLRIYISTEQPTPVKGTICADVHLLSDTSAMVSCGGKVGRWITIISTVGPARLVLCKINVHIHPFPTTIDEGVACGTNQNGVWRAGTCSSHCTGHKLCSSCAADHLCRWCEGTNACVPMQTQDRTNSGSTLCPSVSDVKVDIASQCHLLKPLESVTRETYFHINTQWTLYGLRTSYGFRNSFPWDVQHLSSFAAGDTRENFGERIHGFYVPSVTGSYRFYIRSRQGYFAELYLNPGGTDPQNLTLVAMQSVSSTRPQLSFSHPSVVSTTAVYLQANREYYITSFVFVYSRQTFGEHEVAVAAKRTSDPSPVSKNDIIPGAHLNPYRVKSCLSIDNCFGCVAASGCVWCGALCLEASTASLSLCSTPATDDSQCADCLEFVHCDTCISNKHCEWQEFACRRYSGQASAVTATQGSCPIPCHLHVTCSQCAASETCGWCGSTQTCFAFNGYLTRFANGACRSWYTAIEQCRVCSSFTSCFDCVHQYECGWVFTDDNFANGTCIDGDFTGPYDPEWKHRVSQASVNLSYVYTHCPDVDECRFGLDNCPDNSICVNELEGIHLQSFRCECRPGYNMIDDSEFLKCEPLCPGCIRGNCISPNICLCDPLFWGPNCTQCLPIGAWMLQTLNDTSTESASFQNRTDVENNLHTRLNSDNPCGYNASCIPEETSADVIVFYNASAQQQWMGELWPNLTALSFTCQCNPKHFSLGHPSEGCLPSCDKFGCVHGRCTSPDYCECDDGWTGSNCTICAQENHAKCHEHAICFDDNGKLGCQCAPGYVGDGFTTCEPVCDPPCTNLGVCITPNYCQCSPGVFGTSCNKCNASQAQLIHGCDPNATCHAVHSHQTALWNITCTCNDGFHGTAAVCMPKCDACVFGECVRPGECACDTYTSGSACDQCDIISKCSSVAFCTKTYEQLELLVASNATKTTRIAFNITRSQEPSQVGFGFLGETVRILFCYKAVNQKAILFSSDLCYSVKFSPFFAELWRVMFSSQEHNFNVLFYLLYPHVVRILHVSSYVRWFFYTQFILIVV